MNLIKKRVHFKLLLPYNDNGVTGKGHLPRLVRAKNYLLCEG